MQAKEVYWRRYINIFLQINWWLHIASVSPIIRTKPKTVEFPRVDSKQWTTVIRGTDQWVPFPAPTYSLLLRSEYLITLQQSVVQSLFDLWRFPLEIGSAELVVTGFVHSFFQWLLADRETECSCVTSRGGVSTGVMSCFFFKNLKIFEVDIKCRSK